VIPLTIWLHFTRSSPTLTYLRLSLLLDCKVEIALQQTVNTDSESLTHASRI